MTKPTTIKSVLNNLVWNVEAAVDGDEVDATVERNEVDEALAAIEQLVLERVIAINSPIPEDLDEDTTDELALALTKNTSAQVKALKQLMGGR